MAACNDKARYVRGACSGLRRRMYWNAARLKDIPIRAFHGALDTTVLPEESVHMVAAVNNSGGKAELTVYPDMAHNSWERAFADDEMWKWMFSQKRG